MGELSREQWLPIVEALEEHIREKKDYCLALSVIPHIEGILDQYQRSVSYTTSVPASGDAKKALRQRLNPEKSKKTLNRIKADIGYTYATESDIRANGLEAALAAGGARELPQQRYWLGLAIARAEAFGMDAEDKVVLRDVLKGLKEPKSHQKKIPVELLISQFLREWSRVIEKEPTLYYDPYAEGPRVSNTREYVSKCLKAVGLDLRDHEHQFEKIVRGVKRVRSMFDLYDRYS